MEPRADIKIAVDPVSTMVCTRCSTQIDTAGKDPFSQLACPSCGAEQIVPARFGSFLLLNLINMGGMGCVYRAMDESLGRLVAIKVMLSSLGEDAAFVESFRREAQAAAKLNHPNIAQIYACGQERNQPYIVMELVSGTRLDKLISEGKGLDPAFVLKVGIDIAEGLKAADEIGLVHGDIKPENILLDEKMNAKLVDFGIATFAAEKHGPEGVWGTPYYIAPEKIRRQEVDARADIYSLGATLYHALARRPPFDGPTPADVVRARLEKSARPLREIRPEVGASIERVVARMLQDQPARRHPTYASLLGDLRSALEELGPHATALAGSRPKRMLIKKPGGAPPLAETPEPGGTSSSGRLVIRKRAPGRVSLTADDGKMTEEKELAAQAAYARQRKVLITILIVVVVCIGLSGGAMCAAQHRKVEAARQALRRQEMHVREQLDKAESTCKSVQASASDVLRVSITMRPHVETAGSLALSVFRQSLEDVERLRDSEPAAAPAGAGEPSAEDARIKRELAEALAQVSRNARLVADKVVFAHELEAAAAETLTEAREIKATESATEHASAIEEYFKAVQPLKDQASVLVADAGKTLKRAQELKAAIDRSLAAAKQEEERRRKAEEHKALVATEVSRVDEIRAACKPALEGMKFTEALGTVSNRAARLETPEAMAQASLLLERIRLLVELKAFLIERITAKPYPWGWHRGGAVYEDIVGANADSIKLRSGAVSWPRMNPPQFMRVLEHYLQVAALRSSATARLYLAAAIWMDENADATNGAACVTKAVAASPAIRKDVDRLLPSKGEAPPASGEAAATPTGAVQGPDEK